MDQEKVAEQKVNAALDKIIEDATKMKKAFSVATKPQKNESEEYGAALGTAFSDIGTDVELLQEAVYSWLNISHDKLMGKLGKPSRPRK